jgi:hypothetical protein
MRASCPAQLILLEFITRTIVGEGTDHGAPHYLVNWLRGSNSGGGEISRTRPDRPWGPPSLLYNGYRVFTGDKAAGA